MSETRIGTISDEIIAGGEALYATSPDTGDIWKYNGSPMNWTHIGRPGSIRLTTNGLPAMAASGNRTVAVVTTPEGGLVWTSWEFGSAGTWTNVRSNGPIKFTNVAPTVSFRTTSGGAKVWLGIKASEDDQIYETLQQADGSFDGWGLIPGVTTNVSPAVSDGNLAVGAPIMVALENQLGNVSYINVSLSDQPPIPPPPNYWTAINPSPLTSMAPALAIVGDGSYMFLAATVIYPVGPNNHIVLFQGSPFRPDHLAAVTDMGFDSNVSPAMASAHNRTVIVAVDPNGVMSYNWWDLGGGGHGWVSLGDNVKTKVAPAVALVDSGKYMFILAQGLDGELWINQGNVGGSIVGWLPAE